ncbi:unnamed protein product [Lathyrus oleraceus]
MDVKLDMTTRQKTGFGFLKTTHARYFLLVIPIDGVGKHMPSVEYHTILKYRLMIPLFLVYEVLLICCKACLDIFGEHTIHCKGSPIFKYQHEFVRDALFDIFRCASIFGKKEVPLNLLTNPQEGK